MEIDERWIDRQKFDLISIIHENIIRTLKFVAEDPMDN